MPSVIELPSLASTPCLNQEYMAAPIGSASATTTSRLRSLRNAPTPESVPPVPIAETKPSTRPPVCCQISGPVVS